MAKVSRFLLHAPPRTLLKAVAFIRATPSTPSLNLGALGALATLPGGLEGGVTITTEAPAAASHGWTYSILLPGPTNPHARFGTMICPNDAQCFVLAHK